MSIPEKKVARKWILLSKTETAVPIEVRTSIEGDNPSDFTIAEGSGPFLLNPAANWS